MYAKVQTRRPVELCPCPLQISLLKQSLEMQLSQSQSSLQQLQHQFSQEREHLRMQLDELQTEHQRRQQRLQEVHCCSMQDMEHARQRDLKVGTHTQTESMEVSLKERQLQSQFTLLNTPCVSEQMCSFVMKHLQTSGLIF